MKRWAQLTLVWSVLTVLLGALVRATNSGAGCGRSWPTCSGDIVPSLSGSRAVEFTHRAASGLALLAVVILVAMVWRRSSPGEPIRRSAAWAGLAMVGEALIGAVIVLYEWVGSDASLARAIAVPLHLVNTLLLLGAITLVIWFAGGGAPLRGRGRIRNLLVIGALGLVLIAATGAVTALADTLFPKDGSGSATTTHFLTDLRIAHPIVAVLVVVLAAWAGRGRNWGTVGILTLVQMAIGAANVWLGTPIVLQLFHLLLADAIWISYIWLGAGLLAKSEANWSGDEVGSWHTIPEHR